MPNLKKRLRRRPNARVSPPAPARVTLASLPIEIIAEILLYTCSPPTVLAVSRTCSFLHRTLAQNPDASFIWRGVRETCKPVPLPDPGDGWKKSEADYAAFVFSDGVCEVCQKPTRAMYVSFAARIRLCGRWRCRNKFLSDFFVDVTPEFLGQVPPNRWVPGIESMRCFYPARENATVWPHVLLYRKRDWEKLNQQYKLYILPAIFEARRTLASTPITNEAQQFLEAKERLPQIMEVSIRLIRWKWEYDGVFKNIKKQNDTWTKNLAEREGWDLEDLVASQTYGSLQRRKTLLLEGIGLEDVDPVRSAIESELLTLQARRKRQNAEATFREKLTEVKRVYGRMRSGGTGTSDGTPGPGEPCVLPPLSVFCALPSVRALKGSPDPSALPPSGASVPSDINSPLALSLISTDVHNWLVPVEKHLMALLGYPNGWQSASKWAVPPLKRVTARFFCRRCGPGNVGRAYQREGCLDFRGVCAHVCVATQGKSIGGPRPEPPEESEVDYGAIADDTSGQDKEKDKGRQKSRAKASDWTVDVFEKDDKAIALVETVLSLGGISEDSPSAITELRQLGNWIRCMTCTGWILMDFDTALGHAQRHASMRIQLLNVYHLIASVVPAERLAFERGATELLLGPGYRGRRLCKKVNYGCKHCYVVQYATVVSDDGPRPMDFNALRSHAREKHGIRRIGDEDFFCYTSLKSEYEKTPQSDL